MTNKISFYDNKDELLSSLPADIPSDTREEIEEAARYYLSDGSELEYAFSFFADCLLVRIFDYGRYYFVFPTPLTDLSDTDAAVDAVVKYSVLEEVDAVFVGVPFDEILVFGRLGYRHFNLDAESEIADTYRVTLKNELMLTDGFSELSDAGLTLSSLTESDASDYASLCRDKDSAGLFGYDVNLDYPDASDMTFIELASRELEYGSAITYAIRNEGALVGDLVLHNFDYKGGADVAIRILAQYRRRGYAARALDIILGSLSSLGLVRLFARVFNENEPSIALFSKKADYSEMQEKVTVFVYEV